MFKVFFHPRNLFGKAVPEMVVKRQDAITDQRNSEDLPPTIMMSSLPANSQDPEVVFDELKVAKLPIDNTPLLQN